MSQKKPFATYPFLIILSQNKHEEDAGFAVSCSLERLLQSTDGAMY